MSKRRPIIPFYSGKNDCVPISRYHNTRRTTKTYAVFAFQSKQKQTNTYRNNRNPIEVTAARRTSSFTSDTCERITTHSLVRRPPTTIEMQYCPIAINHLPLRAAASEWPGCCPCRSRPSPTCTFRIGAARGPYPWRGSSLMHRPPPGARTLSAQCPPPGHEESFRVGSPGHTVGSKKGARNLKIRALFGCE